MGPAIKASVVGVLKKPGRERAAVSIELILCAKNIKKDPLNGLLRFAIIP